MIDNELNLDNYEFYRSERGGKNHVSAHGGVFVGMKKEFHTREDEFHRSYFFVLASYSREEYTSLFFLQPTD